MRKLKLIYQILVNRLSDDFITDLRFRIKEHLNPVCSQCPRCKSTRLRKFSSDNVKVCDDCGFKIEWKLKDKEKRII
jgi:hypothetical protein